jgi:signal transduction histidine kinase
MPWLKSERKVHSEEGIYGAVLVDSSLNITGALCDNEEMLGGSVSDFFKYFDLDYGEEEERLLKDAITNGKEAVIEISSAKETLNLILMPIKLYNKKWWLLILKRRDVTLDELEEIKHNILANISHELLTPITIAKASLEIIDPTPEEEEILSTAMNAIVRLEKLLRDLVRIGQIREPMEAHVLQIREVAEDAFRLMKKNAESKRISIEMSIEDNLPEVEGDRDALVHLMLLLLNNAIKFSPDGGKVKIYARWRAPERSLGRGMVEVCVEDTGIGIPLEEHDRIFDLFYQIDRGPSRRYGGIGLGLFLAKSIVTSHNGEIWVESEPGRGSRFCFTLPTSSGIEKRRL